MMIRRPLTALVTSAALVTLVGVSPAHAVDGPTVSDRPPVALSTGQQAAPTGAADNRSLSTSAVDAANTYLYRDYGVAAGSTYDKLVIGQNLYQPNDAAGYFYAESFYFVGGSDFGGYIGVQTHLTQPGIGDVGHGAIASIWGATGATAAAGATVVHGTEAGQDFWSLHFPWNWQAGHYLRFQVLRGYNSPSNVVTVRIEDQSTPTHVTYTLGTFTLPTTWGGLQGRTVDWIEEYSPSAYASCAAIPRTLAVELGDMTLWSTTTGTAYLTKSTPAIQAGTGCTNSGVSKLGYGWPVNSWQEYINY
jgi:hypothetical protein